MVHLSSHLKSVYISNVAYTMNMDLMIVTIGTPIS